MTFQINHLETECWDWYYKTSTFKNNGKYMFFSDYREQLISLGMHFLRESEIEKIKVVKPNHQMGKNLVLIVYYRDDSLMKYMQYSLQDDMIFAGWKPEWKTQAGIYSIEEKRVMNGGD